MTTIDLLFEFSKVYHVDFGEGDELWKFLKKLKILKQSLDYVYSLRKEVKVYN